jgi:guanylate kinase
MADLEQRLRQRGDDDEATIALRLRNAQAEMDQKDMYRHVLVNDDLDQAKSELIALIDNYRSPS